MSWPFGKSRNEAAPAAPKSNIVPYTIEDLHSYKIIELEQRIKGLEQCVVMISQAVKTLSEVSNANSVTFQKNLMDLANYVMRPRTQIMGEQQEKN